MPEPDDHVKALRLHRAERGLHVLASVTAVVLALGSLIAFLSERRGLATNIAALLSGLFLGWSSFAFARRYRRNRTQGERSEYSEGYDVQRLEMSYRIGSNPNFHVYEAKLRIRVLRDGLTHLERRINWTGRGTRSLAVTSSGHFMMGPEQRYKTWDYFYIFLGRELAAAELADVAYRVDLFPDHFSTVEPHLNFAGTHGVPTELVLRTGFPKEGAPIDATCLTIRRMDNRVVEASPAEVNSAHNEAFWQVQPKMGYEYQLRWNWPHEWYEDLAALVPPDGPSKASEVNAPVDPAL